MKPFVKTMDHWSIPSIGIPCVNTVGKYHWGIPLWKLVVNTLGEYNIRWIPLCMQGYRWRKNHWWKWLVLAKTMGENHWWMLVVKKTFVKVIGDALGENHWWKPLVKAISQENHWWKSLVNFLGLSCCNHVQKLLRSYGASLAIQPV